MAAILSGQSPSLATALSQAAGMTGRSSSGTPKRIERGQDAEALQLSVVDKVEDGRVFVSYLSVGDKVVVEEEEEEGKRDGGHLFIGGMFVSSLLLLLTSSSSSSVV
jgi:hypothetical protein